MFGNLFNQRKQPEVKIPSEPIQSQTTTTQRSASFQAVAGPTIIPSSSPPIIVAPPPLYSEQTNTEKVVSNTALDPTKRQDFSALTHLDTRSTNVLNHAQQETGRIKQALIEPEQILIGLLYDEDIFQLLSQFSVDAAKLTREIQSKEQMGVFVGQPQLSEVSKRIFEGALTLAKQRGVSFIVPEDILVSLFSSSVSASSYLEAQGIKKEQLEAKLAKSADYSVGKKSILETYGIDLTEQARKGELDPISGREKEVERLIHILMRRTKNNPIIIGEAGVGKTAIIEGLGEEIVSGKAPKDFTNKRIIQLDLSSLVAGASHRGEFEERLKNVIKEVLASSGQIILFIDEIHGIIGAGDNEGALDASNIIKPYLARGQLQVIGTTTTAEYRRYFEKDKAFERRFQPILVDEPNEEATMKMLEVLKPKYEKFHKVVIGPEAIKAAVYLSKRYIGERYLPDKAVDLIDEAAAQVRLELQEGKRKDNNIGEEDIQKIVSNWTGIPITKLTENESDKLLHLEDLIHKELINQEAAVVAVAEAVRRGRIGLSSANRPIASFVFLGPTGVGKTELSKVLAEILFGKKEATIRLDMSEYMEKHEVAKLIGAPPGYVGYEEGGQLTEAVRAKPYSIVLLDEVEKAHPDVFNILLQLLEDGRLTDNKGNTISFKNTIIIATSNIGSMMIQQQMEEAKNAKKEDQEKVFEKLSEAVMGELKKFFKPELLNRFDEVVIFKPLTPENMVDVAKLGIQATKKLLADQGLNINIKEKALAQLAKEGYDPIYGARPLRRLIQTAIENPIAILIINKTFITGDTIAIDYDETKEEFVFTKEIAPQREAVAGQASQEQKTGSDGATAPITGSPSVNQVAIPKTGDGQPIQPPPPVVTEPVHGLPPQPIIGSNGTQMSPANT